MRFNRRDTVEPSIVTALQKAGCDVDYAERKPYDLVVKRANTLYLLECKTKSGRLRASQIEFQQRWTGVYFVVRSAEEGLRAVGL